MVHGESSERMVRSIRLDRERIVELLDDLDSVAEAGDGTDSVSHFPTYRYRIKALVAHMRQPDFATPVSFLVPGRNISAEGLAFLHGGFVSPRSRCLLQLVTSDGTWSNVNAVVTQCEVVEGGVHDVRVRFDHAIDPGVYCAEAVRSRVLLVEDDASIARLAKFHLEQLNADTDLAENGEVAIEKAMRTTFDLILMDMEMPVLDGFEATKKLRELGYAGAIAAATALTQPNDAERCLASGCDRYLPKPFSREQLAKIISSVRQEPLFSSFHNDAGMVPLVREFVGGLAARTRALARAVVDQDVDTVRSIARALKAEGTSYGFDSITALADEVEKQILAGKPLDEVKPNVDRLSKMSFQVRAPQELTGTALTDDHPASSETAPAAPNASRAV